MLKTSKIFACGADFLVFPLSFQSKNYFLVHLARRRRKILGNRDYRITAKSLICDNWYNWISRNLYTKEIRGNNYLHYFENLH